jgi:peptide/nickel transport system substrate-binding protein
MIVSPKAAQAAGDKFGEHPVCAGPFKFTERVAQDRIVLDRFADYWNKDAIHFDRIVFLPIPDSTVRLANLQSGGLDMIERLAATDLDAARKDTRLKVATITSLAYNDLTINTQQWRAREEPARPGQAGARGARIVDRPRRAQPGRVQRRVHPRQPMGSAVEPVVRQVACRSRARRRQGQALLAAAGVPHPSLTMMVPTARAAARGAGDPGDGGEAGFDIKIQATEFASAIEARSTGDSRPLPRGWSGRTDPDGNLYNFVSCKAPPALNTGHYCNPDVDAELDAARTASDTGRSAWRITPRSPRSRSPTGR